MKLKNVKALMLITLTFTSAMVLFSNFKTLSVVRSLNGEMTSIELIIGVNDRENVHQELANLVERCNGEIVRTISTRERFLGFVVSLPSTSALSSFYTEMKARKISRYIELNEKVRMVQYEPNDPEWRKEARQWSLWDDNYGIRANWAWNTTLGTHAVRVAVIDSGIDYSHEDLAANYVSVGYDWVNEDHDPMDDFDHGTHCAGIIAAEIDNGKGIAGVAQVELVAEKCIDDEGWGTYSDLASAIIHAIDNCSADTISMSLGFRLRSKTVYDAIKYAYDNGVLLVAAAGNDDWEGISYPAAFDEVIAVTATDDNGQRWREVQWGQWRGSNYGQWVELAAPGKLIFSTIPETEEGIKYRFYSGTSMACPHVAAIAALIWSQYPNMTRDQVRVHLRKTARDFGDSGFDEVYGYGLVDVNASVSQAPPDYDVAIMNWERSSYAELEKPSTVNVTVLNYGTAHDWVNASLLVNRTLVHSELIGLQGGETSTVSLSWTPSTEGVYNLTSHVFSTSSAAEDSVSANVTTEAGIIRVPLCQRSIQEAVDAAQPGDTVLVANGTYHEIVNVWKDNLTIHGENKNSTVVDCKHKNGWGFVIYGRKFINIDGFTIQKTLGGRDSTSNIVRYAGISLIQSMNCTIKGNIIKSNLMGPYAYGLLLTFWSVDNVIIENKIEHNMIGMAIDYWSFDNYIAGNHFYWNAHETSNDSALLLEKTLNNTIYHNNFIDNEPHLKNDTTSSNEWHGRWNVTGNYWDDYTGVDDGSNNRTAGDGVGDTNLPHQKVDKLPLMNATLPGDITHDGEVGTADFARLSVAYGSTPSSPNWDAHADLNEDGKVGIGDFVILSIHYGQNWTQYWG